MTGTGTTLTFACNIECYYHHHHHHHHRHDLLCEGIYTYIPETNYVPREYSVAAVLLFLFMLLISLVSVLNLLYFYISTLLSMCAVPNMAVFYSSLTSCFPGMLLTYFQNDFEIVPVAPITTGITFVFTFHMRCISIVRSLYFRILSAFIIIIIVINLSDLNKDVTPAVVLSVTSAKILLTTVILKHTYFLNQI